MTQDAFFEAFAWELHLRGRSFDRADVRLFVADAWPLIEDDPDVGRWAREYAETRAGAQAGG